MSVKASEPDEPNGRRASESATEGPKGNAHRPGRFQVLALDGGGVRGIFTSALLAQLEEDLGRPVLDHFDLVVGTSTGGIIALGLGAGLPPLKILEFYTAEKDTIFPRGRRLPSPRRLIRPKYEADGLEKALRSAFGERLLGDSKTALVIPTYSLGENDVYLFKTPHHERLRRDYRVPMWAVGMATTAAPTYFPAFRLPQHEVRLIDGGVWANNPALVGVTEAVSMFGHDLAEIRVLSLGTMTSTKAHTRRLDHGGLINWARKATILDVLLAGQSRGAFAQVQHLVGPDNAHRLDAPAPDELVRLDACEPRELIAKAAHYSRLFSPTFEAKFGAHLAPAFRPLHTLTTEAGAHARQ